MLENLSITVLLQLGIAVVMLDESKSSLDCEHTNRYKMSCEISQLGIGLPSLELDWRADLPSAWLLSSCHHVDVNWFKARLRCGALAGQFKAAVF